MQVRTARTSGQRQLYLGTFLIAFATLGLEISLTRFLSVTTWYYLAFFAISAAMLGMTAGAVTVYLRSERFEGERLPRALSLASLGFAIATAVALVLLCIMPMELDRSVAGILSVAATTALCALPFYFSGIAIAAVLTRSELPIGKIYSSDLSGAALGCLAVLAGVELFEVPSLILVFGALGAAAAFAFAGGGTATAAGRASGLTLASLLIIAAVNSIWDGPIVPLVVKGQIEDRSGYLLEKWNSFSRVVVHIGRLSAPQMWGQSPLMPKQSPLMQYHLDIDGDAGTTIRRFESIEDIAHLAYDVTNVAYHVRPQGGACVIGVGGGRDLQSALLLGHERVLGLEVNPVFVELLEGPFEEFAGLARNPSVELVVDEARSYLSRSTDTFSILQMSLIDTWAATGAGAFSLSENALYTVESWRIFFDRLAEDGILTVSRWHSPGNLGETGRVVSLAVASLLQSGALEPSRHIAMVTSGRIATTLVARLPFSAADTTRLREVASRMGFEIVIAPDASPNDASLRAIVTAASADELRDAVADAPLNYEPPTDERPYFFNMLRLERLDEAFAAAPGIVRGNLRATITLVALLACLALFAILTVIVPLSIRSRGDGTARRTTWSAAAYFSLIGAGFMLVEIALLQRLSVFLGHPVYALGVLLFTLIASTGAGSFLSERLRSLVGATPYVLCAVTAVVVLSTTVLLPAVLSKLATVPVGVRIVATVVMLAPLGLLLGTFFPTGMRLARFSGRSDTPWYWALNGIFGVLCSALAVFVSIYFGISTNLILGAACYALLLPCIRGMRAAARSRRTSFETLCPAPLVTREAPG